MDEYLYLWAQWGVINTEQYRYLIQTFGDLKKAWQGIQIDHLIKMGFGSEKARRVFDIRKRIDFKSMTDLMSDLNIQLLCIDDSGYPSCLREIPCPPPFIFLRGELPSFHKSISVVGTRSITHYGQLATESLVRELVYNGFVIVSGLALGVDGCAHATTLNENGVTVAVLGSGIDLIHPRSHLRLAERIIKSGGAVLSEYPLGAPPLPHHFPQRNRIISGLSRGVLVTEGGLRSGALITARYALEQGRDVFAVPTDILRKGTSGTNHIVRRGEAKLIESVTDILEEYNFKPSDKKINVSVNSSQKELLKHISKGGKSIDELVLLTHTNVARLSNDLIDMQLKGLVREMGAEWILS